MELLRPAVNPKEARGQLIWFLVWTAVTAIGAYLTPDAHGHGTHQQLGFPPCPSVLIFDRPCPGCGLTTSWSDLIHGHFGLAFEAHPLGPPLYLLFTASAWLCLYAWRKGQVVVTDNPIMSRLGIAGLILFIGFGGIRMALTPHFGTNGERLLANIITGHRPATRVAKTLPSPKGR